VSNVNGLFAIYIKIYSGQSRKRLKVRVSLRIICVLLIYKIYNTQLNITQVLLLMFHIDFLILYFVNSIIFVNVTYK